MIRSACVVLVLLAVSVLSACSNPVPKPPPKEPPNERALAARIGCTGVSAIPPSVYAVADITCNLPSQTSGDGTTSVNAEIIKFSSAGEERQWFASRPSTNAGGGFIQGNLWVFDTNGMEPDIQHVISVLGGREVATPDPNA
jgi:hypothetical protein